MVSVLIGRGLRRIAFDERIGQGCGPRPDGGIVLVRLAASVKFASGIDWVIHGAKRYRVRLV
jgi:hypothetical protein